MRTTITFADDTAAAVEHLRTKRGIGVSEAVNELVRRGLTTAVERRPVSTTAHDMGEFLIDVSNVAEAIEQLEGPHWR